MENTTNRIFTGKISGALHINTSTITIVTENIPRIHHTEPVQSRGEMKDVNWVL